MITYKTESVIAFDVDDTLVLWHKRGDQIPEDRLLEIQDPYDGKRVMLEKHLPHIKLLKNHLKRGSLVIVWSQNGYEWAKAIMDALYFDYNQNLVIMTKPKTYVDDLPVTDWLNDRIYLNPNSNWGHTHDQE